nr:hypothetical protein [Anaerolineae bacterium]
MGTTLIRILRAPFFLILLLASMPLVFFFFAWVTIGAWFQDLSGKAGITARGWVFAAFGFFVYTSLGLVLPAIIGSYLLGWVGAVITPIVLLAGIAYLGKW